jgi:CreA protein
MANEVKFSGRLTLAFQVSDRGASARWYERMLGCRQLYDVEQMRWCELASPVDGVTIGLTDDGAVERGGPVPTWEVDDVDGARRELESRGVAFEGDTVTVPGFVKFATLFDPDGHRLMLAEDLQASES